MNDEMRLYQRVWMQRYRNEPFRIETKVQIQRFKRFQKTIAEGKCPYCEILIIEMPTHNCLDSGLEPEKLLDLFGSIFN